MHISENLFNDSYIKMQPEPIVCEVTKEDIYGTGWVYKVVVRLGLVILFVSIMEIHIL